MSQVLFSVVVLCLLAGEFKKNCSLKVTVLEITISGAYGLQCNQCSNAAGSPNKCDSPVSVTCSLANSVQTQSSLGLYLNQTSIDAASTTFQCMSINTTVTTNNQSQSVQIEGCVPQSYDACKLKVFSFSTEDRNSCASCASDNCNNFDQDNGGVSPSGPVTECFQCDGQQDCENPSTVTCDYNSAWNTVQKLMTDYNYDFATYMQHPAQTYSCYSANVSFTFNGMPNVWPALIHKGCIFEDLSPCLYNLNNNLGQNVSSCYTCDSNSCNEGSEPNGEQGQCYVCNSYPCLDEEVVTCDQAQVNATYDILREMYSNVPDQSNSMSFECLSLQSKYSVTGLLFFFCKIVF